MKTNRTVVGAGRSTGETQFRATRPREPVEAPVRFEAPAGRQGRVDFWTFYGCA